MPEIPRTEVKDITIELIDASALNVRKDLDAGTEDSSIEDLAESIRQKGLLSPITVRPHGSRYELIVGQRRYLACRRLGLTSIRAIVRYGASDIDSKEISLVENVHRAEMHPLDKARALRELLETYEGDVSRVVKETGIGQQTVKRYLALSSLPPEIQERLSTSEGPAKVSALATLSQTFSDPKEMIVAFDKISGFTQPVQQAILKASQGNVERISGLAEEALAGAFDVRTCHGINRMLVCQELEGLPTDFQKAIVDVIRKQGEAPETDLKEQVRALTRVRQKRAEPKGAR